MANGDLYELIDIQSLFGQEVLNVYHYEQRGTIVPGTDTIAERLLLNWQTQKLPFITACQADDLTHVKLTCRNLFDASDFADLDISVAGASTSPAGTNLSTFDAISFALSASSHDVKSGAKRIAGVAEGDVADGVVTGAGLLAALSDLGDELKSAVQVGSVIMDDIFFPVIIKRVRSGVKPDYEYRLPENTSEKHVADVKEAILRVLVTTQNSRKIGRGA